MKIVFLIIMLALLSRKGYNAWLRGHRTYVRERQEYQSLWEYLIGNGATEAEANRLFRNRALQRALLPMLRQWRFWLVMAVLALLTWGTW